MACGTEREVEDIRRSEGVAGPGDWLARSHVFIDRS